MKTSILICCILTAVFSFKTMASSCSPASYHKININNTTAQNFKLKLLYDSGCRPDILLAKANEKNNKVKNCRGSCLLIGIHSTDTKKYPYYFYKSLWGTASTQFKLIEDKPSHYKIKRE